MNLFCMNFERSGREEEESFIFFWEDERRETRDEIKLMSNEGRLMRVSRGMYGLSITKYYTVLVCSNRLVHLVHNTVVSISSPSS